MWCDHSVYFKNHLWTSTRKQFINGYHSKNFDCNSMDCNAKISLANKLTNDSCCKSHLASFVGKSSDSMEGVANYIMGIQHDNHWKVCP